MATKTCYYEVLGVTRTASDGELKSAFRKAAMVCHPDRNPGDTAAEAKFKELNEAYQVLSDGQKRAAYDRFGHAAFENGGGAGFSGAEGFGSSMADIFDDLFGEMTGRRGGRAQGGANRGSDLRYNMEITLEEAFNGKAASLKLPTSVSCEVCSGSGAKPGAKPKQCATCHGHGRVRAQQGFFAIERTCPTCAGRGEMIDNPCQACSGTGRVTRERQLSVNIPAGVEDGTRIRLAGEGEAGTRGGPSGDLYIFVSTKPHPFFQRDGADLFCRVPISMVQAALGGEISVRTVDGGEAKVKIPEGHRASAITRHAGAALGDVGDLYIQRQRRDPAEPDAAHQGDLLAEFETESSHKSQPEASGFLGNFFENLSGTASPRH